MSSLEGTLASPSPGEQPTLKGSGQECLHRCIFTGQGPGTVQWSLRDLMGVSASSSRKTLFSHPLLSPWPMTPPKTPEPSALYLVACQHHQERNGVFIKCRHPHYPLLPVGVAATQEPFTEQILRDMAFHEHPIIFALSNPTSKAECTPEKCYRVTEVSGECFLPQAGEDSVTMSHPMSRVGRKWSWPPNPGLAPKPRLLPLCLGAQGPLT